MKYLKKALVVLAILLAVCLLTPFIAFIVLHYFVLTPEVLTERVTQEVNERTNVRFGCDKIELSYLDSWPSISLSMENARVRIPAEEASDSVADIVDAKFGRIYGSVQLMELLRERTLCLEDIFVEQPELSVALNQPLPPLIKEEKRKKKREQVKFDIQQVSVRDACLRLRDTKKGHEVELSRLTANVDGNLAAATPSFSFTLSCGTLIGRGIAGLPEQAVSFTVEGACEATEKFNDITLGGTRFFINQFPFEVEGSLHDLTKGKSPSVDVRFALLASNLEELLDFVPEAYLPEKKTLSVTGSTSLRGTVKGGLKESVPDIRVEGYVSRGSFHKTDFKQGIDTISLNLEMRYQESQPDSCYIALHNVKVRGLNSYIEMENRITNLQDVPFVTGDVKGYIDFDYIGREFIPAKVATLHGLMTSNLSFAFNSKDLQEGNLNRIWIDGSLSAKQIIARSAEYELDAYVSGMEMNVGYKKNRSDFIAQAEVLNATADIDSMKLALAQSVFVNLSKLHLRSNTALSNDPAAKVPVTAHLDCASLQAKLDKSNWISTSGLELHAGTKPTAVNRQKSEGAVVVKAERLKYLDSYQQNAVVMEEGNFIAEFHPTEKVKPTDTGWDIKGMLNFNSSQIYSSLYPLIVSMKPTRLSFQNNQIILNRLQAQVGKSDFTVTGMLHTNPAPKADEPKLEGSLNILSGNIDYDELKQAYLYGEASMSQEKRGTLASLTIDNLEQKMKSRSTEKVEERIVYLPKDVQLDIQMDLDNMTYNEIALQQVRGNIFIKHQQAYSQISTRTSLGKADLCLLYDTRKQDNVKALFDLDLKDVLVGQIHQAVPMVASMLPLVESMDGLADCHLTAETRLDTQMMPVLSSTKAACSIGGQKLVLLDNATFKEIARKFKFKNKERNQIDQISANLLMQDGKIEVIPFLMEWDRYKAIIGGTHSIDFTYDYHVTLLKSPIPIDFGLNLNGTTADMKVKIGKCRYKELYKDGGTRHLQQTEQRMATFRQGITNRIKL